MPPPGAYIATWPPVARHPSAGKDVASDTGRGAIGLFFRVGVFVSDIRRARKISEPRGSEPLKMLCLS